MDAVDPLLISPLFCRYCTAAAHGAWIAVQISGGYFDDFAKHCIKVE